MKMKCKNREIHFSQLSHSAISGGVVLMLCVAAVSTMARAAGTGDRISSEQEALQVLNRLSFGPRPGDVEQVRAMGVQNWINAQLNPQSIDDSAVDQQIAALKELQMSMPDLLLADAGDRGGVKQKLKEIQDGTSKLPERQVERLQAVQQQLDAKGIKFGTSFVALGELMNAKLLRAVESKRQLQEVLVDFWSNHFNLDAKKNNVKVLLINDERDVIRPNVFGKFRDLLEASAKSPAMLEYLDNASSSHNPDQPGMAPGRPGRGRAGQRRRGFLQPISFQPVADTAVDATGMPASSASTPDFVQHPAQQGALGKGGLNENYGRELMELHTLGVDGGYTQEDVINVARCFTGWTYDRKTGEFAFRPYMHDNGTKTVLGHVIPPGGGINDGEQVLDILASSPATAHHLSYELCQRLVADNPPPALVNRVAGVWRQTDGDLKAVVRAIVTSPEFYSAAVYRSKIKSPFEYVVSAVRALGGDVIFPSDPGEFRQLMFNDGISSSRPNNKRAFRQGEFTTLAQQISLIGEPMFSCLPPTGYTENSQDWVSAGALIARLNFSLALANGDVDNVVASPSTLLLQVDEHNASEIQQNLIEGILHMPLSVATQKTLTRETATAGLVNRRKLSALIIGSPEFQRR